MYESATFSGDEMDYEVSIIRVFTDKTTPTLGNPAGVVISKEMLSSPEMGAVGLAAKQPITAFLSPRSSTYAAYDIRYYDLGGRECHICGHATLAATARLVKSDPALDGKDIVFYLNPDLFEGNEKTIVSHVRGKALSIDLFPSILRYESDPALNRKIAEVLGIETSDIDTVAFSVNIRDYVVALNDPSVLLRLKPNFTSMKSMAEAGTYTHEGLMVSCKAPHGDGYDLYVRVFLPITGVNEDIACGSGNCSIIPLWYDKGLNRDTRHYKTLFPFPEGKAGFVGGIQYVEYSPEGQRITITSHVAYEQTMRIEKTFLVGMAQKIHRRTLG